MSVNEELPKILKEISLQDLQRIDVALEGDWSSTVVTVWSRERGRHGFSEIVRSHPIYKPSLELCFEDTWVGLHCFKRIDYQNVFDEELALEIIGHVEKGTSKPQKSEGGA